MCGIAGYFSREGPPLHEAAVEPMLKAIQHRGPDGFGTYSDPNCVLGHARLSIIDLEGGWQPIFNEDDSLAIVFNGEIYNYLELQKNLNGRGHRFKTRSDTEVILHAYEEWGDGCLDRFNGQFSFAVYDRRDCSLFFARDRVGVRPLYYCWRNRTLVFASEVKALFASGLVQPELCEEGLQEIYVYWTNVFPNTPFHEVYELPPGHMMKVTREGATISRYWTVPSVEESGLDDAEYIEGLAYHLQRSIRLRLRADVPVGAYLSGGLDSALTTAMIRRVTDAPIKTFSIEFTDPAFDESVHQKEMVRFLGTDHSSIRCGPDEIAENFGNAIWSAERPLLRTAPVPMYLLARLVRAEGYKVVVTGEGADEFFLGYDIFKETKVRQFCSRQPDSAMRPHLLGRLYPYLFRDPRAARFQRSFFLKRFREIGDPFYGHRIRWGLGAGVLDFLREDAERISPSLRESRLLSNLPSGFSGCGPLERTQLVEIETLLSGYLLSSQGDRVAMAQSVEGRYPFLDHELIEFASRIPSTRKMPGLDEKHLLKKFGKSFLPAGILSRKKFPYRAPDFQGFLAWDRGREFLEELMSPAAIADSGVFDAGKVTRLYRQAVLRNKSGMTYTDNLVLMAALSTQLFLRFFFRSWETMRMRRFEPGDHVRKTTRTTMMEGRKCN